MTPNEEKKLAKLERDNVLFILAALFRGVSCSRGLGEILNASESFEMAESQLKEAEKRGIAVTKLP